MATETCSNPLPRKPRPFVNATFLSTAIRDLETPPFRLRIPSCSPSASESSTGSCQQGVTGIHLLFFEQRMDKRERVVRLHWTLATLDEK